ncbi:Ig-like domain-containing protein [Vibrio owensii]|uniref:Ig-like domain-containing protein n=1 Tax=Vibrio owensii TaxID=696485 RepID=UPI0018F11499|nr:Ig-like domain-containing protein [Vibrio owensii]
MNFMKRMCFTFLTIGLLGCNNGDDGLVGHSPVEPPLPKDTITDLVVTPKNSAIPVGLTQSLTVEEVWSNGQAREITKNTELTWSSSDESMASVSSEGTVIGLNVGIVTITASREIDGQTFTDSVQLAITEAIVTALNIFPPSQSVPVGFLTHLSATATLSDGRVIDVTEQPTLNWSSSDTEIAAISNNGAITGESIGSVTITATGEANGEVFTNTALINVTEAVVTKLEIIETSSSTPLGIDVDFSAVATLSNGQVIDVTESSELDWSSSNTDIAKISNKGVATGVTIGTIKISASTESNGEVFGASVDLSITEAVITNLSVTSKEDTIPAGFVAEFAATARFSDGRIVDVTNQTDLSWSTDDKNISTIGNTTGTKGVATGLSVGAATITASIDNNEQTFTASAILSITEAIMTGLEVSPSNANSPVGLTTSFTATAFLSDGRTVNVTNQPNIIWHSIDSDIARVSNQDATKGTVTGERVGMVEISAMDSNDNSLIGTVNFEVTEAIVAALKVSPETGSTTPIGLTSSFTAEATLSDGRTLDITKEPTTIWHSSDSAIASVSNQDATKGTTTGKMIGNTIISASTENNGNRFSSSAELSVTEVIVTSLSINATDNTIAAGLTTSMMATATLSDGSTIDVTNEPTITWQSDDTATASIHSANVVKGVSQGNVNITASGEFDGQIFSAMDSITITEAIPVSLAVTPQPQETLDTPQIPVTWHKSLYAHATLSDGSIVDVTGDERLLWQSNNEAIASVSNALATKGQALGQSVGITTISATLSFNDSSVSDSTTMTITPPHNATFYVNSKTFNNMVAGIPIQYIGYNIHDGNYLALGGTEYLDSGMSSIYLGGEIGSTIEQHKFYLNQSSANPISGALKYKATFTWPDSSVTEGILEWDFVADNYKLVDTKPVESLLVNQWYFTVVISNEIEF